MYLSKRQSLPTTALEVMVYKKHGSEQSQYVLEGHSLFRLLRLEGWHLMGAP